MTEDDPEEDDPASTARDQTPQPASPSEERTPREEAERYARLAAEQPDAIHGEEHRIIALLRPADPSAPIESRLERRVAASTALARLASEDSSAIDGYVEDLVDELQREHIREIPAESAQIEAVSLEITDTLVETIALTIADQPETITELDGLSDYVAAITTDLETETLRMAAKAFFESASELQRPGPVVETLGELVTYPDSVVQAWSAGALGQLAEEYPDAVATTADDLRSLLDHDDETVQHNVIEALAALVDTHPDAIAPAADALRTLLDHEDVAIQHNATGVLGQLAETHPDAVIPAVENLHTLRDHDDQAVRRIATGTLARLAQKRPDAVTDS